MPSKKTASKQFEAANLASDPETQIELEYSTQQDLFAAQPTLVQRFIESQAHTLADAIILSLTQVRFKLPDQVVIDPQARTLMPVPASQREQQAGGLLDRFIRTELRMQIKQRLIEMEASSNKAVAVSAALMRHTTAMNLVHNMLPAGRTVRYNTAEGEEIPSLPIEDVHEPESAIMAMTDAVAEEGGDGVIKLEKTTRGELQVPFVPAARRFYLPQWVAFDAEGKLLVNSVSEAEAHVASMQRFIWILHAAVGLASYVIVDEDYQKKRYGMLGQLVNQGRALARYQTNEIIRTIKRRAKSNDLNRGLSISLPYFDDQDLVMKTYFFEVIPAGRIMFVPAFVVRAAREESAKVEQDTRLSPSSRKHVLAEFHALEIAFDLPPRHS